MRAEPLILDDAAEQRRNASKRRSNRVAEEKVGGAPLGLCVPISCDLAQSSLQSRLEREISA